MDCKYYSEQSFNDIFTKPSYANHSAPFSILHSNIRSFSANGADMNNLLSLFTHRFSVVCLSETWLNSYNYSAAIIPNYSPVHLYRTDRTGGGVSIFVHNRFSYIERNDLSSMHSCCEAIFIEINKNSMNSERNVLVGCIYRPPKSCIAEFNDRLKSLLTSLTGEKKHIYLTGDFNINLLNADSHILTSEFIELMFSTSLLPTINKPTRVGRSSATIIDNIFINNTHYNVIDAGILTSDISDHFPVFCITPFNEHSSSRVNYVTKRKYNDLNKAKFESRMSEINWNLCYNESDCQKAFTFFYDNFMECFNYAYPRSNVKIGYKNKKPWLSDEIKICIKKKNDLYRRYVKSKEQNDLQIYRSFKRSLRANLRRAERDHYDQLFTLHKNNLRKSWDIIREVIHKNQHSSDKNITIELNGKETTDLSLISNAFNEYFVNVGPSVSKYS